MSSYVPVPPGFITVVPMSEVWTPGPSGQDWITIQSSAPVPLVNTSLTPYVVPSPLQMSAKVWAPAPVPLLQLPEARTPGLFAEDLKATWTPAPFPLSWATTPSEMDVSSLEMSCLRVEWHSDSKQGRKRQCGKIEVDGTVETFCKRQRAAVDRDVFPKAAFDKLNAIPGILELAVEMGFLSH
ncbi:hypothetical protein GN956_G24627 [Arapaima gigas]